MTPKNPRSITAIRAGLDQQAAPAPRIRSDESIGRPEDIGTLAPARPPKPIRTTLDLDDHRHSVLKDSGATIAQILRALIDEYEADPELAARVRARIWAEKR